MTEHKYLIFFIALLTVVPAGALLASYSPHLRALTFFALIFGTVLDSSRYTINFLSREWYRGTTRGIEIDWLDFAVLILLFSTQFARLVGGGDGDGRGGEGEGGRGGARLTWPPGLGPMVAMLVWSCVSVATSDPHLFGVFELSKMLRGLLAFLAVAYFIRGRRELELLVFAVACALVYEGGIAIQQRYLHHIARVGGTLQHPNALSFYCCLCSPVVLAAAFSEASRRKRLFYAVAAAAGFVAVLLTVSRTGVAAIVFVLLGTVVACVGLKFRLTWKRVGQGLVGAVVAVAILGSAVQAITQRFESEEAARSERGTYYHLASKIFDAQPFGVGLNNWSYAVTQYYGPRFIEMPYTPYVGVDREPDRIPLRGIDSAQAPPAHSLVALTLGELGWPGLLILALMWGRWLQMGGSFLRKRSPTVVSRLGLGVFFGLLGALFQSLSEWTFRQTELYFMLHLLAGALSAAYWIRQREAAAARQYWEKRWDSPRPRLLTTTYPTLRRVFRRV